MKAECRVEGTVFEISLSGRLTYTDLPQFERIVSNLAGQAASGYIYDLANLEFIDSSGLGMLLVARDIAKRAGRSIRLRGAHGRVKRELELSRFDSLFA